MDWGSWHCPGDRDQDLPHGKEMQKSKMAVWGGLTNSCEKKRSESKGEKERYKHLNAEFQRIARRDKKAFLSDQCKEIEENNRTGKARDQWHPTPVLLHGKSHGRRSLVGCSPRGREESDTTARLHFHFYALEKEMATHSSVLAWRIPGMGEPGGLPSMGSHRVGHDWGDLAAAAAAEISSRKLEIPREHFMQSWAR